MQTVVAFVGECVVALFRFKTDINTYDVDRQFLWGPALLITPVIEEVRFLSHLFFEMIRGPIPNAEVVPYNNHNSRAQTRRESRLGSG